MPLSDTETRQLIGSVAELLARMKNVEAILADDRADSIRREASRDLETVASRQENERYREQVELRLRSLEDFRSRARGVGIPATGAWSLIVAVSAALLTAAFTHNL